MHNQEYPDAGRLPDVHFGHHLERDPIFFVQNSAFPGTARLLAANWLQGTQNDECLTTVGFVQGLHFACGVYPAGRIDDQDTLAFELGKIKIGTIQGGGAQAWKLDMAAEGVMGLAPSNQGAFEFGEGGQADEGNDGEVDMRERFMPRKQE